jgi:tetratricopeptide (TPR) repeat protein
MSAAKPVGVRMLIVAWAMGILAGFFLGRAFAPGTLAGGDPGESRPAAGSEPPGGEDSLASARAASDAGRYAEARELYRGVLEREPGNLSARVDLGVAELALGDEAAARASFGAALAGPSPHPAAAYNLALLAEQGGDRPEAARYYALYLKLAPDGPRAADARAKVGGGKPPR